MKRFLMFMIIFLIFPISVFAMSAESAIVMDGYSGRVLYAKNIHKQKLIASITKIMTCLVALENGKLKSEIEVGEEILKSYGSGIYVQIGEKITLEDLLYGLMLRSGNDAALVIANYVGGSVEKFVSMMNKKAHEIGMKNTIFYNPHGLEDSKGIGNISTAYDMALLTRQAIKNPTYQLISGTSKKTVVTNYKTYIWFNKNRLLGTYEYATGGKTGFTEKARRTLVTTALKDDKSLIVVTLNDGNDFNDHKNFYEEYFNKYNLVKVLDKQNFNVEENYYKDELYIKNDYQMLLTEEEENNVVLDINLKKVKKYDDNERVGKVKILLNNNPIYEEQIFINKKKTEKKIGIFKKISNWFKTN